MEFALELSTLSTFGRYSEDHLPGALRSIAFQEDTFNYYLVACWRDFEASF